MTGRRLSTAEAAARLGVKPQTLYAYVSRGLIDRRRTATGSTYDAADVERLARGGRHPAGPAGGAWTFTTEITLIEADRYAYRGTDAVALSRCRRFEEVAGWLWTGQWPDPSDEPWAPAAPVAEVVAAATGVLPAGTPPADRLRVAAAAAATADPWRHDRAPAAVVSTAKGLLAAMVDALPAVGAAASGGPGAGDGAGGFGAGGSADASGRTEAGGFGGAVGGAGGSGAAGAGAGGGACAGAHRSGGGLADRLWPRLSRLPATTQRVAVLDAALVLLADHELAASTLAARTAAAMGADPYAVVGAGLGAASGPFHAASSLEVLPLLTRAEQVGAAVALGEALSRGPMVHGFGQPLYAGGDPRGKELLGRQRQLLEVGRDPDVVEDLVTLAAQRQLPSPNIDFALAALAFRTAMVPGASEAVFLLARSAGWIAHALEEYQQRTRFRARAIYVGERD
ncbi:MAG TPA: citrate/2-methylcitrate synthase [Acidimicrobiales bacterium]|nr:citrate/2-methylcitrate synthase [Acidimicrobiales bacterium]